MQIINIDQHQDGSAWAATVEIRGVIYRAAYVANRLTCGLAPYRRHPRHPRWALEAVRKWAEKQVAQLPAEWLQMHRAMYA